MSSTGRMMVFRRRAVRSVTGATNPDATPRGGNERKRFIDFLRSRGDPRGVLAQSPPPSRPTIEPASP